MPQAPLLLVCWEIAQLATVMRMPALGFQWSGRSAAAHTSAVPLIQHAWGSRKRCRGHCKASYLPQVFAQLQGVCCWMLA